MRHAFRAEQWVPYPVELVFAFFANPENLPVLMPRWQRTRIEEAQFAPPPPRPQSGSTPRLRSFAAGIGSRVTLSFRPFPYSPVRLPWQAHITAFAWNDHFCDEQAGGPFHYWRHCHHFHAETRNAVNGTLVVDDLSYELPLAPVGELAHRLLLRRQIERTFAYRQARLLEIFARITAPR